jgi:hypothetical protein
VTWTTSRAAECLHGWFVADGTDTVATLSTYKNSADDAPGSMQHTRPDKENMQGKKEHNEHNDPSAHMGILQRLYRQSSTGSGKHT